MNILPVIPACFQGFFFKKITADVDDLMSDPNIRAATKEFENRKYLVVQRNLEKDKRHLPEEGVRGRRCSCGGE